MVGLDAVGQMTILYKLKLGEIVTIIPTIGEFFNLCVPPFVFWRWFQNCIACYPMCFHCFNCHLLVHL
jgi:hypothetical protein